MCIRDSSDHWATQFQWAATADHMYRLALEQNDVNCQAIALTMRAFCMAHCTDGFGDVPFTEAFQGRDGLAQPLFDTQRSIYERLYEDLELANSCLLYTSYDPVCRGAVAAVVRRRRSAGEGGCPRHFRD